MGIEELQDYRTLITLYFKTCYFNFDKEFYKDEEIFDILKISKKAI